jgi:putative transposase
VLRERQVRISMDGKGRCMDSIFIERLWRSAKHEHLGQHVYGDLSEARAISLSLEGVAETDH